MEIYALFTIIGVIVVASLLACSSDSLTCRLFDKDAGETA